MKKKSVGEQDKPCLLLLPTPLPWQPNLVMRKSQLLFEIHGAPASRAEREAEKV